MLQSHTLQILTGVVVTALIIYVLRCIYVWVHVGLGMGMVDMVWYGA